MTDLRDLSLLELRDILRQAGNVKLTIRQSLGWESRKALAALAPYTRTVDAVIAELTRRERGGR